MTTSQSDFQLNRPGALIAALPAVLGFVPEKSLVLVTVDRGELGCVMRVDLSPELLGSVEHLAEVAAAACPDAAIAVVVDAEGAACRLCNDEYLALSKELSDHLAGHAIELIDFHVVDTVGPHGRWHSAGGGWGTVDDPAASPLAMAAVLDGRRLYARREDLQAVITIADAVASEALGEMIRGQDALGTDAKRDVRDAMAAGERVAAGERLSHALTVRLARALTDPQVRDVFYALAVGDAAAHAEALWAALARTLPEPWRVEALVLLAFSAYARGDGPLAGVSLEAALRCDAEHRMAGMLDTALQSGMRPEQIRELAATGYRLAKRLGITLPQPRDFGRRAG
ncbi:DUF4192 domain-containing protein [Mycobacterium sp. ITM-2016-00318]|uniref:DUF4192 domain-containing protein n=1 Tax=Mycobacterium sp. ITM-2016-00318 TaxID=2099693 RepID=UPI000CF9075E|nr:DUF4192 domain-containing protein [Mycobacterium sp. ITM-2016-00318]WNG94936.1 DUF4192 domain-containing protein [Mycobacterium sp. ITM-2016-00318]